MTFHLSQPDPNLLYELALPFAFAVPSDTPARDIVLRLNMEINRAIREPDVSEKLVNAGLTIVTESPEYFAEYLKRDYAKYGKLVKDIGFTPQ